MRDRFSTEGPKDFPIPTFVLWDSASCLPAFSIPGEVAQMLKSTVEGYEVLEKTGRQPIAPMLEEPLPPEYEQELERKARKYHHLKYSDEEKSKSEGEDSTTRLVIPH